VHRLRRYVTGRYFVRSPAERIDGANGGIEEVRTENRKQLLFKCTENGFCLQGAFVCPEPVLAKSITVFYPRKLKKKAGFCSCASAGHRRAQYPFGILIQFVY